MATELQLKRERGTIPSQVVTLRGFIEITAAGAINSQSGQRSSGVTWTKNAAAGRYDGVLHMGYARLIHGDVAVEFPTAGTVPTLADGNMGYVQGVPVAAMNGSSTGLSTVTIQCTRTDTQAAANPTSGNIITYELILSKVKTP